MKCQIMLNRFCMTLAESWHVDRPAIPPIVSNIKSKSYLNLLQECHMESHQLKELVPPDIPQWISQCTARIRCSGEPETSLLQLSSSPDTPAQDSCTKLCSTDLILISLVSVHMLELVGFPSRALGRFSPWKEPHLVPPHSRGAQGSTELL